MSCVLASFPGLILRIRRCFLRCIQTTYQSLPAVGFNGIPVALLAINNPIGVIFTGCFMSMLDISGLQLTNLTAYNEYITDVIIGVIVYLSAFSLVIRMWLEGKKKKELVEHEDRIGFAEINSVVPHIVFKK